jgi:streptogramin lyase
MQISAFRTERHARNRFFAVAPALALAVAASLGVAPSAAAVPGDVTLSVDVPSSAGLFILYSDVALGPDGNMWTTNTQSNSISRVAPTGGLATTFVAPSANLPTGIIAGPDGAMWFAYGTANKIGRIDMNGNFTEYSFTSGTGAYDIAAGSDGNLWFTIVGAPKVGRITPAGAVTEFDVGVNPQFLTAGPSGSNRLYFTGAVGSPKVGFITTTGTASLVNTGADVQGTFGIATSEDNVWFIETKAASQVLARLVGDTTIQETVLAATNPIGVMAGPNGLTFVTDYGSSNVLQLSPAGALQATYPVGVQPVNGAIGSDGNLWIRSPTKLTRMLTGVVPALSAAPAVTPATGVTIGTSLSTSNGTWKYAPGSYSYAWQRCTSTDVTTCAAVAGATAAQYTASSDDNGKYVRSGVTATNANGASTVAYSALVQVGTSAPPAPPTPPAPAPATGPEATIGSGATAELEAPTSVKRNKRATLEVAFTVTDVAGTVTFTIVKGSKSKTISGVGVSGGTAKTSWKVPSSWAKGTTTINATFTAASGAAYQGANMKTTTKIK